MTPYELGVVKALSEAGLVKSANAIRSMLTGGLVGGGVGALYPQLFGTDPENRVLGAGLGTMLGGGIGVKSHELRRYFKDLASLGKTVMKEEGKTLSEDLRRNTAELRKMLEEFKNRGGRP